MVPPQVPFLGYHTRVLPYVPTPSQDPGSRVPPYGFGSTFLVCLGSPWCNNSWDAYKELDQGNIYSLHKEYKVPPKISTACLPEKKNKKKKRLKRTTRKIRLTKLIQNILHVCWRNALACSIWHVGLLLDQRLLS